MSFNDWSILKQLDAEFLATVRIAFVFGDLGDSALLVTGADDVYGLGTNTSGCLGTGNTNACPSPTKVTLLCSKNVKSFISGGGGTEGSFTVALLQNGQVYRCGCGPIREFACSSFKPVIFPADIRVQLVSCGIRHCVALSDDGKVFTWGQNECGQLGHSSNLRQYNSYPTPSLGTDIPARVENNLADEYAIDISCGARFSAIVVRSGKVFTWGNNKEGQLGVQPEVSFSSVPLQVVFPDEVEISKIACGHSHVLALSKTGELYVWGKNSHFQFALPYETNPIFKPRKLETHLRFIDVCASYKCHLSVAVSRDEEIYVWGECSSGRIISNPMRTECDSVHQAFAFFAKPCIMPNPFRHKLVIKRFGTFISTLEKEFRNPKNSDLTVVVDGKEFRVHRLILILRSEYFKIMLDPWTKTTRNILKIEEKSYAVIEAYLKYIYTDKLDVNLELAIELFQLADEYCDESFKRVCERSMMLNLSPDKVAYVILLGKKHGTSEDFNRFCMNFAMKHAKATIKSPEWKMWDLEMTRCFIAEYVEKKIHIEE